MVVRLNRYRPGVPTFYDTGKVFGFDIEDSEIIGISENVLPYIPDTVMSLTLKYGRRILHTLSEEVSPLLPRCLVYLEATCLNWTQTLKELFWNKDIPEITHIDLRHLTSLTELSITRPQGKLILPSSLHTCYITSWRFRFKPDKLVHLSEASNLRELHLKDCYVVSDLMNSLPKSLTSLMLTECTIENSVVSQIPNTITKLGFDKCRKLSSSGLQNIPSSVVHVLMGFPLHLPWEATVPLNFSDMKFLPNTVTKLTLMNYRMVYTDSLCLPQGVEYVHFFRCCEPTFGSLTSNVKEVWLQECFYDTGRKMQPLDFKLRNERYTLRIT